MKTLVCPECGAKNPEEENQCTKCSADLAIGRLISRGRGVISNKLVWTLKPGSHTIGRTIGNTFIIPNASIPTTAAMINFNHDEKCFYIYPMSSMKGVSVNGTKLTGKKKLSDADVIRFVVEEFEFQSIKHAVAEKAVESTAGMSPEAVVAAAAEKVTHAYAVASNLQRILGYINEFQDAQSIVELAEKLLDAVLDVTKTRRAFFFLINNAGGSEEITLDELAARAAGGQPLQNKSYDISQSFLQKVLDGHGMVIVQDALRENVMTRTMFQHQLRAIVCVPIILRSEATGEMETSGVIYADNFLAHPVADRVGPHAAVVEVGGQATADRPPEGSRRTCDRRVGRHGPGLRGLAGARGTEEPERVT